MDDNQPAPQASTQPVMHPAPKPEAEKPAANPQPETGRKVGRFQLESGIDVPPVGLPRRTPEYDDVLQAMKIGESFVEGEEKSATIRTAAKRLGVKVAIRKHGKLPAMVRVWRIENEAGKDA